MFQTPEAEALDQWFENLQNYEATLEEMAAASLDVNFKEELSAIEQWFKVLSEAERTAALYSLLQHSTQVQIRFFITVLQQMARSDPMTALLSPAMGGSMQNQMEAKLASMKSPALKPGLPTSPTTRNFSANRASLALDNSSNFLSPESAANPGSDAAATLAQQRAKLKASNAAHRISAPVLTTGTLPAWTTGGSQLSQVSEQSAPAQEIVINASRPKSTEFSGNLGSPRPGAGGAEGQTESWASMVNTPLMPMFQKGPPQNLDNAASKLNEWSKSTTPGVPRMGDPTIHRRTKHSGNEGNNGQANGMYDDSGNLIMPGANNVQQNQQGRGANGGMRNTGGNNGFGGTGGWSGSRSPALSNTSSNRFGGNDEGGNLNGLNGLGMQMGPGGFNMSLPSPAMGMMPGLAGMGPMNPIHMNMLSAMGISPETQLLAAQIAAGGFGQPGWLGMQPPVSAGVNNRRGPQSGRSPGLRSASSTGSGSRIDGGTPKAEDDVDPALLNDVPAWLRSLRLHKYTPNFESTTWQEMVMMDEAQLEAKGVAALGARRKMLKTFEVVRKKMGIEGGPPSGIPPSAGLKTA